MTTVSLSSAAPLVAAPDPALAWTLLSEGRDHGAASEFALAADFYPADASVVAGEALALSLSGQTGRGADRLREALRLDPAVLASVPADPRLDERLLALERWLAPLASHAERPSVDALLVVSACQALRGDYALAYFAAARAREFGDRSMAVAAYEAWLAEAVRLAL